MHGSKVGDLTPFCEGFRFFGSSNDGVVDVDGNQKESDAGSPAFLYRMYASARLVIHARKRDVL